MQTFIFYRYFITHTEYHISWTLQNLSEHLTKYSRFTWYIGSENRQVIIKQFNYTVCSLPVNNYLPFKERYNYVNIICRFLETLPPYKQLPTINESTYPEFYI